ncbi:MAG: PIN domain-containing protein [Promethearchaeota archaeon]
MILRIVLDANIWVYALLRKDPFFRLLQHAYSHPPLVMLIIDSYCAIEVLHVLRRLPRSSSISQESLERAFWSILNSTSCLLDFEFPLAKDLITKLRNKTEFLMIAHIFQIEAKDVPYLVLSFKHNVPLITADYRSIYLKRDNINSKLGIEILSITEALERLNA